MIVGAGTSSLASRCVVRRAGAAYISRVAVAVCSANSAFCEVCSTTSWLIAVSVPSGCAPSRSRWMVGVRCPTRVNICGRVSSIFTVRPVTFAAIPAMSWCTCV